MLTEGPYPRGEVFVLWLKPLKVGFTSNPLGTASESLRIALSGKQKFLPKLTCLFYRRNSHGLDQTFQGPLP
jgi:hypothetical protein